MGYHHMQILFSLGLTKILIYRGGVIFWADMVGAKYIASKLNQWAKTYNNFFKPCAFLEERAASGVRLVSNLPVLHFDDSGVGAELNKGYYNKSQGLKGLRHLISNSKSRRLSFQVSESELK